MKFFNKNQVNSLKRKYEKACTEFYINPSDNTRQKVKLTAKELNTKRLWFQSTVSEHI